MREIKFRVWDKERKEMIHSGLDIAIRQLELVYPINRGSKNILLIFDQDAENTLEFMQYTELKDVKGTEIYEGDILKWNPIEWGCDFNEVVKWDYDLLNLRKYNWKKWCEIIGNIYENPKLLDKGKE